MGFFKSIVLTFLIASLTACGSSSGTSEQTSDRTSAESPAGISDQTSDQTSAESPAGISDQTSGQTSDQTSVESPAGTSGETSGSPSPETLPLSQVFDTPQVNTLTVELPGALTLLPTDEDSELSLTVMVDEQIIPMTCCDAAGRWTGSISSSSAALATLELQWSLVTASTTTDIARLRRQTRLSTVAGISIPGSLNYDVSLDSDADGFSNLDEIISNTDALDRYDNIALVNPIDVVIPRIDTEAAPAIDGMLQVSNQDNPGSLSAEWQQATRLDRSGQPLRIGQLMIGDANSGNRSNDHSWAAMHDGLYLYLQVLSDDHGNHYNDTNELRKPWKDDGMELYFDGNNSKLDTYDGVDDVHMHINLFANGTRQANASDTELVSLYRAINSAPLPADLTFATGPLMAANSTANLQGTSSVSSADKRDVYEIRLRLSDLNIQPGKPFGIEIQINDDDDGGTRDSKWAWHHPPATSGIVDQTWKTPSLMGTAILAE